MNPSDKKHINMTLRAFRQRLLRSARSRLALFASSSANAALDGNQSLACQATSKTTEQSVDPAFRVAPRNPAFAYWDSGFADVLFDTAIAANILDRLQFPSKLLQDLYGKLRIGAHAYIEILSKHTRRLPTQPEYASRAGR